MAQVNKGSGRSSTEPVYVVTDARRAHSEEVALRTRRYLISMGIRTVCLVLAIFVLHGPLRWVAVGAAVVLPWLAVVFANSTPVPDATTLTPVGPGQARAIEGDVPPASAGEADPPTSEADEPKSSGP